MSGCLSCNSVCTAVYERDSDWPTSNVDIGLYPDWNSDV